MRKSASCEGIQSEEIRAGVIMTEFVKVKCEKCKNEQMIFERAASVVKCLVCEEILAKPTGGRAVIKAKIIK